MALRCSTAPIGNWCDGNFITPLADNNHLRQSWGLSERFAVGYAGNLGRAHDLETILEAMTALSMRAIAGDVAAQRISFLFVGGGAQRAKLENEVLVRGLKNVQMRDYQAREMLPQVLHVAEVHLVSLNPTLEGLIVPSKFYSVAAAARPSIAEVWWTQS